MLLIICEISLMLTCSLNCLILSDAAANQVTTFEITDTKIYVPVAPLPTQGSAKLLQQVNQVYKQQFISRNFNQK